MVVPALRDPRTRPQAIDDVRRAPSPAQRFKVALVQCGHARCLSDTPGLEPEKFIVSGTIKHVLALPRANEPGQARLAWSRGSGSRCGRPAVSPGDSATEAAHPLWRSPARCPGSQHHVPDAGVRNSPEHGPQSPQGTGSRRPGGDPPRMGDVRLQAAALAPDHEVTNEAAVGATRRLLTCPLRFRYRSATIAVSVRPKRKPGPGLESTGPGQPLTTWRLLPRGV